MRLLLVLFFLCTLTANYVIAAALGQTTGHVPDTADGSDVESRARRDLNQIATTAFNQLSQAALQAGHLMLPALARAAGYFIELFGLIVLNMGRMIKQFGLVTAGTSVEQFGIGVITLGETLRQLDEFGSPDQSAEGSSVAHVWNGFGENYVRNRHSIEAYYAKNQVNIREELPVVAAEGVAGL